jgi:hypothetical protein
MNDTNSVAKTIQAQLGGALVMLGAKNLVALSDSLQFNIQGSRKGNKIVIRLAADDTYTVELWKIRVPDFKKVAEVDGVYVDALKRTITGLTGLFTTL